VFDSSEVVDLRTMCTCAHAVGKTHQKDKTSPRLG